MRSAPTRNHTSRRRAGSTAGPPPKPAIPRAAWTCRTTFAAAVVLLGGLSCGDSGTAPAAPPAPTPVATTMTVSPSAATLAALERTVQLTASVMDQNGRAMAGATVSWSSSDAAVATVDASGLATAVANGAATVTATSGAATANAAITVAQTTSAVAVTSEAASLVTADTLRLTAEAFDANGHAVAGARFAWASSDTLVATVDSTGLVTGVAGGVATVTAESGGVTGAAEIAVDVPVPTTVTVSPAAATLAALGATAQLAAEVLDQAGRAMADEPVRWASSDTLVAVVDSSGLVTATGPGAAEVTAAVGEATGVATVSVMQAAGSVAVEPESATLGPGDTLRLAATAFDANGHAVDGAEFSWSTGDASVATVDGDGLVRGVGEGGTTITAAAGDARGTARIAVANPDRAALVALYNATDGPNWGDTGNNDNWLTDAPLGDWSGVRTDGFGRVVYLALYGYNLSGAIPPELGSLSNLKTLNLGGNDLSGAIPPELGNLSNLEWLVLGGYDRFRSNDLSGTIPPELGGLSNLKSLNLAGNDLSGTIPPELGDLRSLEYLELALNDLEGTIPKSLVGLDVKRFYWSGNHGLCAPGLREFAVWLQGVEDVAGPFCNQSDVAALEGLYEVWGGSAWTNADGWLGGPALDEWHGISTDSLGRVTALDLARNGLTGRLPAQLDELVRMTRLRVGGNALSGSIPPLGNLVNLTELDLSDNALSGRIPRELGNLVNLTELNLSDNALSGAIPRELGGLVNLIEFHYHGTDVCVPSDAALRSWLNGVREHRGTGVDCPQIGAAELARFLRENPRVAAAMTWLGTDNRAKPYDEWPQALKDKLVLAIGKLTGGGGTGLPDVLVNQVAGVLEDDAYPITVASKEDAEDFYVANIAQSLILEMEGGLPWSLEDLSIRELELLLGSRSFFERYGSVSRVSGYKVYGTVSPAPPELVREFIAYNDLIGSSRYETIVRALDWARHMHHHCGPYTTQVFESHWHERGAAPLARKLAGTVRKGIPVYCPTPDTEVHHHTAGCHGTNHFLIHLLRAVNIPAAYVTRTGHATPSFPSEALYLSHGDDPYNGLTKAIPPFPRPFPISEILIDEGAFREWFGEPNTWEERRNNVGRRVVELGVKHLSPYLLRARCGDLAAGRSNAESEVYRPGHAGVGRYWTVEELEEMGFWERMDAKIARYGGCSVFGY